MSSLQQNVKMKQIQELKLTQEMYQALEITQFGYGQLLEHLKEEERENPFMQLQMPKSAPLKPSHSEISTGHLKDVRKQLQGESYKDSAPSFGRESYLSYYHSDQDAGSVIEATQASEYHFYEELEKQIHLSFSHMKERAIARFWLAELDDIGRLSMEAFLQAKTIEPSVEKLESLLEKLQQLEPVGLFSRNVKECLKAQIIDLEEWNDHWAILFEHFYDIHHLGLKEFSKTHHIPQDILHAYFLRLRSLDTHPAFQGELNIERSIIPELIAKKNESHQWEITINEAAFPQIVLQEMNLKKLQSNISEEKINWLKAKSLKGKFLVKALAQRAESILKLGKFILEKQKPFFDYGAAYLSPLKMNEAAEELDLHDSTISRISRNKYIRVENSIIELRWFFQSGIDSELSSIAIQNRMKEIIKLEPQDKPFSDEILLQMLAEEDIHISRRTIAKYRAKENIPSSSQRKKNYNRL